MTTSCKCAAAFAVLGSFLPLAAQDAPTPVPSPAPKSVPLAVGTCAQVNEGDVVTFDWNPAFDTPAAVTGIKDVSLLFARHGEENRARRGKDGLRLEAVPPRTFPAAALADPIVALPNGFYQLKFRVGHAESGEYHLIDADAVPLVAPGYSGKLPEMTHSPAASYFCIDVTAVAPRRGR